MCLFVTKKRNNSHIKTTKKDIFVYKYFFESGKDLISPFRDKKYILNKTYYIQNQTINEYWKYQSPFEIDRIHKGIHSFKTLDSAKSSAIRYGKVLYKCVIPKGSKYVLGSNTKGITKEIVSSKIKVLEKCVY